MLANFNNPYEHYLLWLCLYEVNTRFINLKLEESKGDPEPIMEDINTFRELAEQAITFFSQDLNANLAYISNLYLFLGNIETYTLKDKKKMNYFMEKYIHLNGASFGAWANYIAFEQ